MKVTYEIEIEADETPVRGNAIASGDEAFDTATENLILARLEAGEIEAWCVATVWAVVRVGEHKFSGRAILGGCSYETEAQLKQELLENPGYDLKAEALEDLLSNLKREVARGEAADQALSALSKGNPLL